MSFLKLVWLLLMLFIAYVLLKKSVLPQPVFDFDYIAAYRKILPSNCTSTSAESQYLSVAKNMLSASHGFIRDFDFALHSNPGSQFKLILKCYMTDVFLFIKTYSRNDPATTQMLQSLKLNGKPIQFNLEESLAGSDLQFPLVHLLKFLIILNDGLRSSKDISPEMVDDFKKNYMLFIEQKINPSTTLEMYLLKTSSNEITPTFKSDQDLGLLNNLLKNILPDYIFLTTDRTQRADSICSIIGSNINNMVAWITAKVTDVINVVRIGEILKFFDSFKYQVGPIANLLSNVPQLYNRYNFIFSKLNCPLEDKVATYFGLKISSNYLITELIENEKFRNALLSNRVFFESLGDNAHLIKIILLLGLLTELPFTNIKLDTTLFPGSLAIIPCKLITENGGIDALAGILNVVGGLFPDVALPSQTSVTACSLLDIMEHINSSAFDTKNFLTIGPMLQYHVKQLQTSGPIALQVLNGALLEVDSI